MRRYLELSRRNLLACAVSLRGMPAIGASERPAIRAMAFDAFVLFSPGEIIARAREIAGSDADALVKTASARLFAYTWHYTAASSYAPFDHLAVAAFAEAAAVMGLHLPKAACAHIAAGYCELGTWPDVLPLLDELQRRGIRLALLSDLPSRALHANLQRGKIAHHFEFVLSTDMVRKFKPARGAYALATSAFGLRPSDIGFAASAQWDAAGATWFGFPAIWLNRAGAPYEEAFASEALESSDIKAIVELVTR